MFVHITSAKHQRHIRLTGLKAGDSRRGGLGLYALPVLPNYFVSHQWMRELRKWGKGPLIGVYFRIPDDDNVLVGRYNMPHQQMTADQVVASFLTHDASEILGYEVIIPHAITPESIHRIRYLGKPIGWRHFPGAHGRQPCGCGWCSRGEYNSRRFRTP